MAGERERLLYAGKAQNLRQRLNSYRHVQPERASRKVVGLIHEVRSVVWEVCSCPATAPMREKELLLGVWLNLTERHQHKHRHEPMEHEHLHHHDEHQQRAHRSDDPPDDPHTHWHHREELVHSHPHYPDLHHRHGH